MPTSFSSLPTVLLVEDNPGDVRLTLEAFKLSGRSTHLQVVHDGEEALQYLRRLPPYEAANRPDLILLDLNLPRLGGREVLDRIKTDPHLRAIPVVILTTSQSQKDIAECYESQASCYLVKPLDFDCFTAMLQQIEDFWFSIACLPRQV